MGLICGSSCIVIFDEPEELVVGRSAHLESDVGCQNTPPPVDLRAARARHMTVDDEGAFLNLKVRRARHVSVDDQGTLLKILQENSLDNSDLASTVASAADDCEARCEDFSEDEDAPTSARFEKFSAPVSLEKPLVADTATSSSHKSTISGMPLKDGWCCDVDTTDVRGLGESSQLTRLIGARVSLSKPSGGKSPWEPGESLEFHEELGMRDAHKQYLAVWLNLGSSSLVFILEFLNDVNLELFMAEDFLTRRLKFLTNPVSMPGGRPCELPKDADTVGAFFGKRSTSCTRAVAKSGASYLSVQIDVFSKWYVKILFQQVALRPGNILDVLLVDQDGPGLAVLAACRLKVTKQLLQLLSA